MIFTAFASMILVASQSAAAPEPRTVSVEDVEGGDAMALAARLLPAEIRADVVEGKIGALYLPGTAYRASYLGRAAGVDTDRCTRKWYWVDLKSRERAAPGLLLTASEANAGDLFAILPAGVVADERSCAAAPGYVSVLKGSQAPYQMSAYRRFMAMRSAAIDGEPLGSQVQCAGEAPDACADMRRALAGLPLDKLYHVGVTNQRKTYDDPNGRVRIVTHPAISEQDRYLVELSFGQSGEDGKSWRMSWIDGPGGPSDMVLKRSTVIYH